jgi:hypothetical protein
MIRELVALQQEAPATIMTKNSLDALSIVEVLIKQLIAQTVSRALKETEMKAFIKIGQISAIQNCLEARVRMDKC